MSTQNLTNTPAVHSRRGIEEKLTGIPRRRQLIALISPASLWLFFLLLLPLFTLVMLSFVKTAFGEGSTVLTLEHYRSFLENTIYQRLLWRSLGIALLVTVLTLLFSYPVAYFMAYFAGERQNLLLTILIIPAWTSFLLRVLAWRLILGSNGLLNTFLMGIGIIQEPITGLFFSTPAVVITLVYIWIPFAVLPIYVSLQRIEGNLFEASADLGARPWQTFWKVIFPLSMPGILAAFLFVFIPTVGEYVTPALVGGPNGLMIGNIIWDQFSRGLDWPMGATLSLMMMLIVILPLFLSSGLAERLGLTGGSDE
jgi:spermidine/putrescine transport system permease protein